MAEAPCTSLYEKGLEDLGDEITCPICQDHFQEPKVLPCLHYYCKECIRSLARRNNPFSCPECRRDTTLPQNDPDQLPTAFFVNRMKEVHTKMEKADGKVKTKCEMCSGEEAEAFCRQCTYFICADCVRSHKKMKVFAAHQVVTLVELKQGGTRQIPINEVPPTVCKEHDEPMKIFCFDCDRLICRDCVIDGHTDHKREFIKKYAVQCRSMVTESLTPLKQIQADMKQCTKAVESTEADVSAQHATVSDTIRQSFAEIASVLKQREQQLLDKASQMRDQKLDALGAQKKSLQIAQAESQSLIEFVEHSLEGATDEEVIAIYQQILPRVEEESHRHKQISLLPTTGGKLSVEISYNSDEILRISRVYDTTPSPALSLHSDSFSDDIGEVNLQAPETLSFPGDSEVEDLFAPASPIIYSLPPLNSERKKVEDLCAPASPIHFAAEYVPVRPKPLLVSASSYSELASNVYHNPSSITYLPAPPEPVLPEPEPARVYKPPEWPYSSKAQISKQEYNKKKSSRRHLF